MPAALTGTFRALHKSRRPCLCDFATDSDSDPGPNPDPDSDPNSDSNICAKSLVSPVTYMELKF